jgi:hypothetical protein
MSHRPKLSEWQLGGKSNPSNVNTVDLVLDEGARGVRGLAATFTMVQFLWQHNLVSVARVVTDCFDFLRSADSPSNLP